MRLIRGQFHFRLAVLQIKSNVLPDQFDTPCIHQRGTLAGECQSGAQMRHQIIALKIHIV